MSLVTNVILSFSILENASLRLDEVNKYFDDRAQGMWERLFELPDDAYSGTKSLERPTCVGAFNYLNLWQGFLPHVANVNWDHPENVQVFVCDQDENSYTDRFPDAYINFCQNKASVARYRANLKG
jgi:hypothetical protein